MVTRREDSIKELNKRKTNEQLAKENEELREQVKENTDALIELAAMIAGED